MLFLQSMINIYLFIINSYCANLYLGVYKHRYTQKTYISVQHISLDLYIAELIQKYSAILCLKSSIFLASIADTGRLFHILVVAGKNE